MSNKGASGVQNFNPGIYDVTTTGSMPQLVAVHPKDIVSPVISTSRSVLTWIRMKFKKGGLWPLIDTLNSSIDWDNLGERLYVTTTAHYVLFKDT